MEQAATRLRAIDLYSGVGGWSLGLRLAGIDVVASYDLWRPANLTNSNNNHHEAHTIDLRSFPLSELPRDIDVVVGSPPCVQFSLSNRGGRGDVDDGLKDIIAFLTIVDYLRPRAWAMENVPRVAKVLEKELKRGGQLEAFAHLGMKFSVENMAEYGLPQRRRRCIAGNINFQLLRSYRAVAPTRTLGDVVAALSATPVRDPLFGVTVDRSELQDHVIEPFLNSEEERINRAAKMFHPIYNAMPFPDPLTRSVRTITATCTRVSRESVVIQEPGSDRLFRRLSIREKACLQGFPLSFQFYGKNYGHKQRMVGNAFPPVFSYYTGHALLGTPVAAVGGLDMAVPQCSNASLLPPKTWPDNPGTRYPPDRNFRFAIPSLRLKSGVRFELRNKTQDNLPSWEVGFVFGTSKSIHELRLDEVLRRRLTQNLDWSLLGRVTESLGELSEFMASADIGRMQKSWSRSGLSATTPFMLLDALDEAAERLTAALLPYGQVARRLVAEAVQEQHSDTAEVAGLDKLYRHSALVLAGLLVGSLANYQISSLTPSQASENTRHACAKARRSSVSSDAPSSLLVAV